jgi:hypothetical protein
MMRLWYITLAYLLTIFMLILQIGAWATITGDRYNLSGHGGGEIALLLISIPINVGLAIYGFVLLILERAPIASSVLILLNLIPPGFATGLFLLSVMRG